MNRQHPRSGVLFFCKQFLMGQFVPFKHYKGMYVKRTFRMYCLMKGALVMENSRIKIKTDGAFSQIFIDGKKLNGVRNYKLEHAAGKAPILTLDLNAFDLTVDGQMLLMQKGVGEIDVSIKG